MLPEKRTLDVSERELTYLSLALKHFENKLFADMGEEVSDALDDLLMVQWLQRKLVALKQSPPTNEEQNGD